MTKGALLLIGAAIAFCAGATETRADDRTTTSDAVSERSRGRVLMVIENDGAPEDRRVWDESRTLSAAGWNVTVICPQTRDADQAAQETIDGIEIHRYPLRPAETTLGYFREYGQALWRTLAAGQPAAARAPVRRRPPRQPAGLHVPRDPCADARPAR